MIVEFFRRLWPVPEEGNVVFFLLSPDGKEKNSLHAPLRGLLDDPDPGASEEVLRQQSAGKHTYFGLGLRDPDARLKASQQGAKRHIIALPAFAIDVDIIDGRAHVAKNLPRNKDEAFEIINAIGLPPSIVVDSGYGYQAYWVLSKPLLWKPDKHGKTEDLLRRFQERFVIRAQQMGCHLDDTATVQRVWRLPGFDNVKVPGEPRRASILLDQENLYAVEDLVATDRGLLTPASPGSFLLRSYPPAQAVVAVEPPGPAPSSPGSNPETGGSTTFSASPPVAAPAVVPMSTEAVELVQQLQQVDNPASQTLWKILLAGEVLQPGSRDIALRDAAASLTGLPLSRKFSAEHLADLFRPSIDRMAREQDNPANPPPTIETVIQKIQSGWDYAERKEKEKQESLQTLKSLIFKGAPRTDHHGNTIDDAASLVNTEAYQSADPIRVSIITFKENYYVRNYVSNNYSVAKSHSELPVYLRDAWDTPNKPQQCQLAYANQDGAVRQKTVPMLLQQYGTNADKVVYHMGIQDSRFNPTTRAFYHAVTPLRVTEPLYNSQIDAWLKILFRESVEKAFDWLATFTLLSRQTCALFLSGPKGAGKTFLAQCLSRLWTTDGPAKYTDIVGNFNADLLKCPLIFADEDVPDSKEHRVLPTIREITGTTIRTLSEKYMNNVALHGAVRILLCANDDEMLVSAREEMGHDAFQATCTRILHIPVPLDAVDYLTAVGREVTHTWLEGDAFAKHVLWLRDHRAVDISGRFLVEGPLLASNRRLLSSNPLSDQIHEWLLRYATDPSAVVAAWIAGGRKTLRARIGKGRLLINVDAVTEFWEEYIRPRNAPCPPTGKIARLLKSLSTGQIRGRHENGSLGMRYHQIDANYLLEVADRSQIGDADRIKVHLEREYEENELPKKMQEKKMADKVVSTTNGRVIPFSEHLATEPPKES